MMGLAMPAEAQDWRPSRERPGTAQVRSGRRDRPAAWWSAACWRWSRAEEEVRTAQASGGAGADRYRPGRRQRYGRCRARQRADRPDAGMTSLSSAGLYDGDMTADNVCSGSGKPGRA